MGRGLTETSGALGARNPANARGVSLVWDAPARVYVAHVVALSPRLARLTKLAYCDETANQLTVTLLLTLQLLPPKVRHRSWKPFTVTLATVGRQLLLENVFV